MTKQPSPEEQWMQRARDELIPKLERSNIVVSLVPDGPGDVKYAVELGFSILMDKPIIFIVRPGSKVSRKLVLVADRIIEVSDADWADTDILQRRVLGVLEELTLERGQDPHWRDPRSESGS